MTTREFLSGTEGVAHEPGAHYPGRDWRVFTGWGVCWCVASEQEAWMVLAEALRERGATYWAAAAARRAQR